MKPLSTKGGIKSRVSRGHFHGSNWWSLRWMEILESSIDAARLSRGRSYARRGQVVDIEIEPGLVTASVQGTRKKPYQIRLGFETLTDEWASLLFRFRRDRVRQGFCRRDAGGDGEGVREAGVGLFQINRPAPLQMYLPGRRGTVQAYNRRAFAACRGL